MAFSSLLKKITDQVFEYFELRLQLLKLTLVKKVAGGVSDSVAALIPLLIITVAFLFINIAVAALIAELTGRYSIGFGSVAIFYLIMTVIYNYGFREKLRSGLNDRLISKMMENEQNDK